MLLETKEDLAVSQFIGVLLMCICNKCQLLNLAPIIGHVGDGNFHSLIMIDPESEHELSAAKELALRMSKYV